MATHVDMQAAAYHGKWAKNIRVLLSLYFTLNSRFMSRYLIMFMFYGSRDALIRHTREGHGVIHIGTVFICLFINKLTQVFPPSFSSNFSFTLVDDLSTSRHTQKKTVLLRQSKQPQYREEDFFLVSEMQSCELYKHETTNEFVEQLLIKVNLRFMICF